MHRPGLLAITLAVAAVVLVAGVALASAFQATVSPPTAATLDLGVVTDVEGAPLTEARRCTLDGEEETRREIEASILPGAWVTSAAVTACPSAFDGKQVRYVGELIGDLLPRRGGAWVLVNDDDYALDVGPLTSHRAHRGTNRGLTVWLPDPLVAEVGGLGRPGFRGDVVEVAGTVLRNDPDDGGGLTIRASDLRVVRPGAAVEEPLNRPQLLFASAVSLVALGLWVVRRRAAAARSAG